MDITRRDLAAILTAHVCRNDYDGFCIGCDCEGDRGDWRDGKIPERDHDWHVQHLLDLAAAKNEVYADQELMRRARAGEYSTVTPDMFTRTPEEAEAELRRLGFL